ncbi:MAG: response regulator [Desulfobacteraceae bacterium]|nr:response regulator [Desulfobacteraceae bacterium]
MKTKEDKTKFSNQSIEKAQKVRIYRFGLALITYFLVSFITFMINFIGIGHMANAQWAVYLIYAFAGNTIFLILFLKKINLRFHDPSLTREQMIFAASWGMISLYFLPDARPIVLMFYIPAFSFGMLRLNLKQYLSVVIAIMGMYASVLCIEHFILQRLMSFKYEFFIFTLFGTLITWFAFFGGWISTLRKKLKNQNQKIRESHEKLKHEQEERNKISNMLTAAVQQSPSGVIIADAPDVKIRYANPAAFLIRGSSEKGLTEIDVTKHAIKWQTYKPDAITPYPAEDLPLSRAILKGETTKNEEVIIKDETGVDRWVSVNAAPIFNEDKKITAGIVIFHDISDRKNAENTLKLSQESFLTILDSIDATIYVTDIKTYEILFMNKCMIKNFGEDFTGKRCFETFKNRSTPCKNCTNDKLFDKDGHPDDVYIWQGKNKRTNKWYINYDRAIKWIDGRIVRVQIASDISKLKLMEEKLVHSQKMEAIGTLAGGIAHDFNNLLMGISGHLSLIMLDTNSSHPFHKSLKDIGECVENATSLTDQLLGYARGGKYEIQSSDISTILNQTSDMFWRTHKEINIHKNYEQPVWAVEIDQGQINQVLINLYVNALYAMPQGGDIFLKTRNLIVDDKNEIQSSDIEPGKYVRITVQDTGEGMSKTTQSKIFDPFFTTKEMGRGTGLGLASSYGIIKNHNGAIFVSSDPGRGSKFSIYLPASSKAVVNPPVNQLNIKKGNEKILIVDDEKMILDTCCKMLKKLGYKVFTADSGQTALKVFNENQNEIDLVILDMIMPDMKGGETYDELMKINSTTKVLLSSGYSLSGDADQIMERGCNGFIQKPFRLQELSEKIREIIEN